MTEVWRDLPEMPDYQVSDLGRIRSIDRQIEMKSRWGGMCAKLQRGRVLTPFRAGNYLAIRPQMGGKTYYVHRLVASTFLITSPERVEVNHKDGDKANNRADNLEWCTPSENMLHSTYVLGNTRGQFASASG